MARNKRGNSPVQHNVHRHQGQRGSFESRQRNRFEQRQQRKWFTSHGAATLLNIVTFGLFGMIRRACGAVIASGASARRRCMVHRACKARKQRRRAQKIARRTTRFYATNRRGSL